MPQKNKWGVTMSINKRYYWLKLPKDFFQSETIRWLEEQPNGIYYSNFYLKLCLMSINDNGMLIRQVGDMYIPYDVKRLSELTNINADTIMVAIDLLKRLGLLEILDNGAFYLNQVKNMVGSETESTKRSRKSREKNKALQCNTNATNLKQISNNNSVKNATAENRDKRIDNRVVEDNNSTTTNNLQYCCSLYKREISRNSLDCSPIEVSKIKNLLELYGKEKFESAVDIAVLRNSRLLGYIEGILKKNNINSEVENKNSLTIEEQEALNRPPKSLLDTILEEGSNNGQSNTSS